MVSSLYGTLWKYRISLENKKHVLTLEVLRAEHISPDPLCAQCLEGCMVLAASWILIK